MNGAVHALTIYNGELIAGGDFTTAGGVTVNRIARWDGQQWAPLGSGMNGLVGALTAYNGELIAGGWFTTAGGVSANHIARWDGQQWSPLGSGMSGVSAGALLPGVHALAVYNGELLAGGSFTTAAGISADGIARWDGQQWAPLGGGMNGLVGALAAYNGELFAGGRFVAADESNANHIARWDGQRWAPLGSGMNPLVSALGAYNGELIAAGHVPEGIMSEFPIPFIHYWDGQQWAPLGGGIGGFRVHALGVHDGELIAGGSFWTAGGVSANCIARWNGQQWAPLGNGMNDWVHTLAVYDGELIAGGRFTTAGGVSANYIARWDGQQWAPLGSGMNGSVLFALTVYNGELIAGGWFTTAGGVSANHIARWDGQQWSPLGNGMNGGVEALTIYNGELIAGGSFTTAGGVSANRIARWDGQQWAPLGSGMNSYVGALAVYNGEMLAGGVFTTAGGISANRIARWNGQQWAPLENGMNSYVSALGVYNGELLVGGGFTTAGGQISAYFARWDDCLSPLLSVTPASYAAFGSIQIGTSVDRVFTVQNNGGQTLSGMASVAPPFSIVSGGAYTLEADEQQAVTVRYSPTAQGSHARTLSFTGPAVTVGREVSGIALTEAPAFGTIAGRVVREDTEQPIPRAGIKAGGKRTSTNESGQYTIEGLAPGTYTVDAVKITTPDRFDTILIPDVEVAAGVTTVVDIVATEQSLDDLQPESVPVVLVRGRGRDTSWTQVTPNQQCWDDDNAYCYWSGVRNRLRGEGFTQVWDCNEPDPAAGLAGNMINGELGIAINSANLDFYIYKKLQRYKAAHEGRLPRAIHIVAHSMGGLIVRQYLADRRLTSVPVASVIMLGTPNAGSKLADPLVCLSQYGLSVGLDNLLGCHWASTKNLRTKYVQNSFVRDFPADVDLYLLAGTSRFSSGAAGLMFTGLLLELTDPWDVENPDPDLVAPRNDGAVTRLSAFGDYFRYTVSLLYPKLPTTGIGKETSFPAAANARERALAPLDHYDVRDHWSVANWVLGRLRYGRNGNAYEAPQGSAFEPASFEPASTQETEPAFAQQFHDESGVIPAGGVAELSLPSEASADLAFIISWEGSGLVPYLLDPSGSVVDPTGSQSDPEILMYEIASPASGVWTAILDAGAATDDVSYYLQGSGRSDLALAPTTASRLSLGQEIVLGCALISGEGEGGSPVTGAAVEVRVVAPDGAEAVVQLLDDGLHADGAAGDGIYGGVYAGSEQPGEYALVYRASGTTPSQMPFARVVYDTFTVSEATAFISCDPSEQALDLNADGLTDVVALSVCVTAEEPGVYALSGELLNETQQVELVGSATLMELPAGTSMVDLHFYQDAIVQPGTYGPFALRNLSLFSQTDDGLIWLDSWRDTYVTETELIVPDLPAIPGDFDDDGDVDMDDFGFLQACLSGVGLAPPTPACTDADVDNDGDVDAVDVWSFRNCLSGADIQADPDCMN